MMRQGSTGSAGAARRRLGVALAVLLAALLGACAGSGRPPLQALDRQIDLPRFMGDWYVIGFIPITIPFFSEEDAHNAVESYRLVGDGEIAVTYTFREGAFDGPEKRYTPKAWVHDEATRAEWRVQFVWPFEAAYLIVYVDPDYRHALIGVPDRSHVWILSREPEVPDEEYERLVGRAAALGYVPERIRRVPQRWPSG